MHTYDSSYETYESGEAPSVSAAEFRRRKLKQERAERRRKWQAKIMAIIREREEQHRKEHELDCLTWGCTCKIKYEKPKMPIDELEKKRR